MYKRLFWKTVKFANIVKLLLMTVIEITLLMICNYVYIISHIYDQNPEINLSLSLFLIHLSIFCFSCQNVITFYEKISDFLGSLELEFLAGL